MALSKLIKKINNINLLLLHFLHLLLLFLLEHGLGFPLAVKPDVGIPEPDEGVNLARLCLFLQLREVRLPVSWEVLPIMGALLDHLLVFLLGGLEVLLVEGGLLDLELTEFHWSLLSRERVSVVLDDNLGIGGGLLVGFGHQHTKISGSVPCGLVLLLVERPLPQAVILLAEGVVELALLVKLFSKSLDGAARSFHLLLLQQPSVFEGQTLLDGLALDPMQILERIRQFAERLGVLHDEFQPLI